MSTEDVRAFLEQTSRNRGYTLEMHRIMAAADVEWFKKYGEFIEATYTGQRMLDRKTKELLQIAVDTACTLEYTSGQNVSGGTGMTTVLERPRVRVPITGTAIIYYRVSGGRQEEGVSLDV
jgi:4-carboxymuconolactone decarboxylase